MFLDIDMPFIDGFKVAEILQKHQINTLIVFVNSAYFNKYLEENHIDTKKANEIAKKMIENNISLEMIKITTGLSDEEIKQLM